MLSVNIFLLTYFRALKKQERIKKLKLLYEKIKKEIKIKFRYCNLYVKNLPDNFDDDLLKELFAKYGKIRSAKTVRKELYQSYLGIKRSVKVCGYVCFQDPESAKEAKSALNASSPFPNLSKLFVDYHQNKWDRAEVLKLKQIHQFSKGGNKNQEMQNQNMVIKQMQMGGRI
jgi:polyadenylate-binding protein